jgi:hypothetical protein
VVAADFTAAIGNLYTRKVRELEEAKDEEDVQVKPPAFSKETKWIPFFKLLVNYLSSVTGVNKVPLDYVVRKDDNVADPDAKFETEHWCCRLPIRGRRSTKTTEKFGSR